MKKNIAASTVSAAAASSLPPSLWSYPSEISSILESFDPRQGLANFIQPQSNSQSLSLAEPESPSHLVHSPSASSPSPKLSLNKPLNCTSSSHSLVTGSLINGMASPQQLINATGAIAFPSNAHQQQPSQSPQHQHPSQHSPQQQSPLGSQALSLQNNSIVNSGVHHLLSQNLLNSNSRPKAKQRTSNGGGQSNGGLSVHSPLFGASVAFPGNPLQPQQLSQHQQNQSFQQQLQNSSSRQMQQQQHSPQQGVLLSTLSNPNGSPVRSLANQANTLSSSNAAQLVAAVAAANANNPAYVSSWPCPACKIGFRSANELQAHLSAHFVPSQNANHKAQHLVQNNFNSSGHQSAQSQQQQHQSQQHHAFNHNPNVAAKKDSSVHLKKDKSVPCQECGKLFASAERVRVHVRVAHGEKTCACEICGCGFSYRCKLLNHMRTHTGDKPFTCEVCGRSFSQKNHLKRHHMIHTGERPFPCEICGRSFYRKDKLTRHRRIHTNTNPSGRGGRNSAAVAAAAANAKNVAASMVLNPNNVDVAAAAAVAAAANKAGISPGIAQSFSSLPGATIQLIPVSMAAQIGANRNWVPLAHHGDHHQRSGIPEQKSPIDARQQNLKLN